MVVVVGWHLLKLPTKSFVVVVVVDMSICGGGGGTIKKKKINNTKKPSDWVEKELRLLKDFEYSGTSQTTDNTDVASVTVTLESLFKQLKRDSDKFQLHIKCYSKKNNTTRCVTITEYLTDYLINTNASFRCAENYPTIYNWLTSFKDVLSYNDEEEESAASEDKDSSSEEEYEED